MTRGKAGIDPLGNYFTFEAFRSLVENNPEHSVYQFLTDHDVLATVSEEHAFAILENAQIEDKRGVSSLSQPELHRFHREIRDTLGHLIEGHHGYEE